MIWKVILGICPTLPSLNNFFEVRRRRQFDHLTLGLRALNCSNSELDNVLRIETVERVVFLILLDQGLLPVSIGAQSLDIKYVSPLAGYYRHLINILEDNFISDDNDQFWLCKSIYPKLDSVIIQLQKQNGNNTILSKMKLLILDRGGQYARVVNDIERLNLFDFIPLENWILSAGAPILPNDCLCRIIDFIISDKAHIIFFLICEWLMRGGGVLSDASNAKEAIQNLIKSNSDDDASQIVEFSIFLFRKYESHPTLNFRLSQ